MINAQVNRQRVLDWLVAQVPKSRLDHMLRVEETAVELAGVHGLDVALAADAGLLHDLAKYFAPQRLLDLARAEGLPVDPVAEDCPHLLHGPVSAVVARQQFGVGDERVLAAIANHTLGSPAMDDLSCVLFLADGIEPGRGQQPKLEAIREASTQNLYQAVALLCDLKLKRLMKQKGAIHPQMILTRNWALQRAKARGAQD